MQQLSILLILLTTVSCSLMERRTHIREMETNADPFFVPHDDFMVVSGDSGQEYRTSSEVAGRTPASIREQGIKDEDYSLRRELIELENAQPEDLYRHYARNQHLFSSASDKIYFLRLQTYDERDDFIRNLSANYEDSPGSYIYKENSLTLGMSMKSVKEMWGYPVRREVAGNPINKNEKWLFDRQEGSTYVYFENGAVGGWEKP